MEKVFRRWEFVTPLAPFPSFSFFSPEAQGVVPRDPNALPLIFVQAQSSDPSSFSGPVHRQGRTFRMKIEYRRTSKTVADI